MRIANLIVAGVETPSVLDSARGWVPLAGLGTGLAEDVPGLIATGLGEDVRDRLLTAAAAAPDAGVVPVDAAVFTAPLGPRSPRISPYPTSRSIPATAVIGGSPGNRFTTPESERGGGIIARG